MFISKMFEKAKCCKEFRKKYFKKELFRRKKNEHNFQMANKGHICNKLYTRKDIWVRDHCHITWSVNYRLTQKIPAIFHDYRGFDSVTHRISYNARN